MNQRCPVDTTTYFSGYLIGSTPNDVIPSTCKPPNPLAFTTLTLRCVLVLTSSEQLNLAAGGGIEPAIRGVVLYSYAFCCFAPCFIFYTKLGKPSCFLVFLQETKKEKTKTSDKFVRHLHGPYTPACGPWLV